MAERRLNQILAVEGDIKNRAQRKLTDVHHDFSKSTLLNGLVRSYEPVDENGETFPPESQRVQLKAGEAVAGVVDELTAWWNTAAAKERGNAKAMADVVVGDVTVLKDVPVTYLLFLEKRLIDLRTFIAKLPTLDPSQDWTFSTESDAFATDFMKTAKTKKIPRNHVKAAATDRHPAQVEVYFEDVDVGYWSRRLFSGALSAERVNILSKRLAALQDAVKTARESANNLAVPDADDGKKILDYLFD